MTYLMLMSLVQGGQSLVQVWSASIPFLQNMDGKPVCACGSKLTRLSDRMLLVWADHEHNGHSMDTQWTLNGHYNGHYNGHW